MIIKYISLCYILFKVKYIYKCTYICGKMIEYAFIRLKVSLTITLITNQKCILHKLYIYLPLVVYAFNTIICMLYNMTVNQPFFTFYESQKSYVENRKKQNVKYGE